MSSPQGKRDIVRLRTFAGDVERARTEQGIEEPITADVLPNEVETPDEQGVLHKVKKKSLDLKEAEKNTKLDAEGITFDEEVAQQVEEQAYEEHKTIQDGTGAETDVVDVHAETAGTAAAYLATTPNPPAETPTPAAPPAPEPVAQPEAESEAIVIPKPPRPIDIKAEETIDQIKEVKDESLGVVHDVSDGDLSGGEIVTDKKRDRFKLFPAIGQAMGNWFEDTKETIEEVQREKHTVTKTEKRVETIKAAAQKKTLAPEEDFEQVAERLKHTKKTTSNNAPVVLKPKPEVEARWTHVIGEGGKEQPESATVETSTETPTAPTTAETSLASKITEAAGESVVPPSAPAPEPAPPITPTTEAPVVREIQNANITAEDLAKLTHTEAQPTGELAAQAHQQIATEAQTRRTVRKKTSRSSLRGMFSSSDTTKKRELLPSPVLAMIVVVIAIAGGVGTSLYFFGLPSSEPATVPTVSTKPLFTAQLQTDIPWSGSHAELMNTLLSAVNSNPGSIFMYFTRNAGAELVPTTEILGLLAPQVPGSFARSVTDISFGALDSRPFIVLKSNNFDIAFSGMLAWEQTMSADLSPLFGAPVTESLDPQARTNSQTRGAFFKDIVASNLSGRLLVNERGEDRILYVFVDKQTIVITTDRLQLSNILPLIR